MVDDGIILLGMGVVPAVVGAGVISAPEGVTLLGVVPSANGAAILVDARVFPFLAHVTLPVDTEVAVFVDGAAVLPVLEQFYV